MSAETLNEAMARHGLTKGRKIGAERFEVSHPDESGPPVVATIAEIWDLIRNLDAEIEWQEDHMREAQEKGWYL